MKTTVTVKPFSTDHDYFVIEIGKSCYTLTVPVEESERYRFEFSCCESKEEIQRLIDLIR